MTVIDIADGALERAKGRLGPAAQSIRWARADVAASGWSISPVDVWHDRAVFHFLTQPADRQIYVSHLFQSVKPGGIVVIATFANDGPTKCSGLPVCRYSPENLQHELGPGLEILEARREDHRTPAGVIQAFQWVVFRRL